ncbi:unnamed protein product [Acanthoscelides obtectus]|uniref:Uncharacterized protein n=1 Tax=Acanthoscelides obtectus TaxID=200917 RepID=A0A9P0NWF7_ACAOB|nr:unnamed protein product [Acanthoscelides obtectus]CAK1648987.1 hypothetical protein AOBTE_LOCUS15986 [Acanthoscelides obtectus]
MDTIQLVRKDIRNALHLAQTAHMLASTIPYILWLGSPPTYLPQPCLTTGSATRVMPPQGGS